MTYWLTFGEILATAFLHLTYGVVYVLVGAVVIILALIIAAGCYSFYLNEYNKAVDRRKADVPEQTTTIQTNK